ncbi:MAG: hypothetical protein HC882_01130 [Acidobacteria bacterium]|nr:hypothetical protein [Acidobacteriota bacterium]
MDPEASDADFWRKEAHRVLATIGGLTPSLRRFSGLLETMALERTSDSLETLRAAYEWLRESVSVEEVDPVERDLPYLVGARRFLKSRTPADVIDERRGTPEEVRLTFLALAKALGVEHQIALVTDRTVRHWQREWRSTEHFDATLTVIGGRDDECSAATVVDAASGLPWGEVPSRDTGIIAALLTSEGVSDFEIPEREPSRSDAAVSAGRTRCGPQAASASFPW